MLNDGADEIREWFRERGMIITLEEGAGDVRALVASVSGDRAVVGFGKTELEALQHAQTKYERGEWSKRVIVAPAARATAAANPPRVVIVNQATEQDEALPMTVIQGAGGIESEEAFGTGSVQSVEVDPDLAEKIGAHSWILLVFDNPLGSGSCACLVDLETQQLLKAAVGEDDAAALRALVKDTYRPSGEAAGDPSDPRSTS